MRTAHCTALHVPRQSFGSLLLPKAFLASCASPMRTAGCTVLHVPQQSFGSLLLSKASRITRGVRSALAHCELQAARSCMLQADGTDMPCSLSALSRASCSRALTCGDSAFCDNTCCC